MIDLARLQSYIEASTLTQWWAWFIPCLGSEMEVWDCGKWSLHLILDKEGTVMSLELIIFWSPLSFSAYIFKHAHWHGDKRRHIHTINRPQMWARAEPLLCSARENRQSHAKASLETRMTRSASKTIWHCINLPCNYKRFHLHLSKTLFSHVFPHCIGAIGFLQG